MHAVALLPLALAALAACSSRPEEPVVAAAPTGPASHVGAALTEPAAQALAADAARFATVRLPPTVAGVSLATAPDDTTLAPAILTALRGAGLTARADDAVLPHRLAYAVVPLDDGVVLRLDLDRATAARPFKKGRGGDLRAAGPMTVMEEAR